MHCNSDLTFVNNANCSTDTNKHDELSVNNLNKICRTCLEAGEFKPILNLSFEEVSFKELFETCISVTIKEDDDLPKNICDNCIADMVHSYYFLNKCRESLKTLQLIINNKNAHRSDGEIGQIDDVNDGEEIVAENCNITQPKQTYSGNKQAKENTNGEVDNLIRDIDEFLQAGGEDLQMTHVGGEEENIIEEFEKSIMVECDVLIKDYEVVPERQGMSIVNEILGEFVEEEIEKQMENDFRTKTRAANLINTCSVCNVKFDTKEEFTKHRKEAGHGRLRNHVCHVCGKTFEFNHLKQHMRTHTQEKPFECKYCSKKFSLKGNLKRHIKSHTGERPHMCEVCGKGFIQGPSLKEHMRLHTGERPYICCYCGKGFAQAGLYNLHLRKHEAEINGEKKTVNYTCETCGKQFRTNTALKTHALVHGHKRFLCSSCGKGFVTRAGLKSHFKVHTGEKTYKCEKCGKMFAHYSTIKSHLLSHAGLRPYTCKVCLKSFRQNSHLMYHMRIHRGERPYVCTYCGKAFALNGTLKVHIRLHTGETPYKCDICGKGFHASNTMKKHRKIHDVNVKKENGQ